MNRILLVFDDIKELEHIEVNLTRNGFKILKSSSLKDALTKTEGTMPDLIVVNTLDAEKEVELFSKQVKMKYLRKVLLPSLIELKDYLNIQTREHLVIRELLRNKKYRNNEIVFFISQKELASRPN
jgi:PleD family two-component response regulator